MIERAVRDELLTHDMTERALEEAAAACNDLLRWISMSLTATTDLTRSVASTSAHEPTS